MLTANNLTLSIGRKRIVDRVSLDLCPGEVVAVVGPNGAGKSTLLKLLTGDWKPSAGSVSVMGRPLESWSRQELARRRAVLLQSSHLSFAFSVSEVVLMGRIPHNHGTESARDYDIAEQALAYVGMSRFADRLYQTLSGGEQQRVHLARVLAQIWEPPAAGERYLLLDEPTSSLDLLYQQQVLNVARQFARAGTAVLVILHDLNLAAQYADRILMLKAGQARYVGVPQQVLTSHHIQEVYDTPVAVIAHPHSNTLLVTPLPLETAVAGGFNFALGSISEIGPG